LGKPSCALVAVLMMSAAVMAAGASHGASIGFSYSPMKPEVGETINVAETLSDPGVVQKIIVTVYYEDKYGAVIYPVIFQRDLIRDMGYSQLPSGECDIAYSFTATSVGKLRLNVGLSPQNNITSHTIDVYAVGKGHTAPIDGTEPTGNDSSRTIAVSVIAILTISAAVVAVVLIRKRGTPPKSDLPKKTPRDKRKGKQR
jgi:hypothetical protein